MNILGLSLADNYDAGWNLTHAILGGCVCPISPVHKKMFRFLKSKGDPFYYVEPAKRQMRAETLFEKYTLMKRQGKNVNFADGCLAFLAECGKMDKGSLPDQIEITSEKLLENLEEEM